MRATTLPPFCAASKSSGWRRLERWSVCCPDSTYSQATLQLQSGDVLLAFTDGISEAMTMDDEEWGEERMIAGAQERLLAQKSGARDLMQHLTRSADAFYEGTPQHDDMTLIVLELE